VIIRTSADLTLERVFNDPIVNEKNTLVRSIHAVTVPGLPAAYVDILDHFGSKKFDLKTIMEPAITMAEEG
jgi:gamma-glutamyltranspeptidase/glutathione hydrolase